MHILAWSFLLLINAPNIIYSHQYRCDYVRNAVVDHRDAIIDSSSWDNTTVSGCISDSSFNNKIVVDAKFACETISIPKLETHFITNMTNLRHLLIEYCKVEVIEPGAFSDLPALETLKIEGNPLKKICRGVFDKLPSLQKLYIYYNRVSYIQDHAFANLPNLKYFSLEHNKLNHLKREWFTNTSNIQQFLADRNSIRGIPPKMFHGWKYLSELNLNANSISFIADGTFTNVAPIMEHLTLHQNQLTLLSAKIFSESVFIENLFISGNLLNFLSKEFLEDIRVNNIYLFGNPFKCSCLDRIYKILLDREVTVDDPTDTDYVQPCKDSDVPICGNPVNNSRTCIDTVDKEVTRQIILHMKNIGYDRVHTESGYDCAMFDQDYLEPR